MLNLHEKKEDSMLSLNEDNKKFEEDQLNELAIKSILTWRELLPLQAYCAYIYQNKFPIHDQNFVKKTLIKHAQITKLLIRFFHSLFDPNTKEISSDIKMQIQHEIEKVKDNNRNEAIALSKLLELMNYTLRTNYYQKDKNGNFKDYLSIKPDTLNIKYNQSPMVFAGIFVYSKDMAGCVLRGGKVSRGGLRWSDREDFRTEVLALMRAQKLKNTIIVPDGAKGGFILRNTKPNMSKEETLQAGIAAYKTLLRGFLDLTDNEIDGKIVKPKDVVCRDGDDSYLVVAADRGTGDFSDIANSISKEYNFWLGDAFASGGSTGYSHKKLAITSRSTWVSVVEHFNLLGIDPDRDEFTVTGIGSMAGDVSGNGLLLSRKMKLLAAFSSKWIFVDPNPSPEQSFKERERLFALPNSNWIDYDTKLISKGGGVFSRKADSIPVSEEMKTLFKLKVSEITPNELIKSILKTEVDLLWNGGLGTYVKAEAETHEQVRDKSTDSVRINAKEVKCKVVGEGGNLGFTQAARVEYALAGGLINTDFIDNSGGVDCSDHEVNFKIALNKALSEEKITEEERVKLLHEMTSFVVLSVISNSERQNKLLSFGVESSAYSLVPYVKLISILEKKAELDSAFERLPDEKELDKRNTQKIGLTRPELSILLSYSKRAAIKDLMQADEKFIQDFCTALLLAYFPEKMQNSFKDEILHHQLRKEICITRLANNIIDHTGMCFFHELQTSMGVSAIDITKAYLIASKEADMEMAWKQVEQEVNYKLRVKLFYTTRKKLCKKIVRTLSK